jgi:hypothetical protein
VFLKSYSDEYVYDLLVKTLKKCQMKYGTQYSKNNIGIILKATKIKNQGVANVISYIALKGASLGVVYLQNNLQKIFTNYGYTLKPKQNVTIMNVNWSNLDDEYIDIINELDSKGKSPELFDKLFFGYESDIIPSDKRKEDDILINKFYLLNKPYASSIKDKTLFLGGILGVIGGLVILSRLE